MKKLTRILMLAYSIMLLSPIAVLAQVDQTFWFVVPETTREHAKTPGVLRITAFQNAANVRISQPANPNFQPITLSVLAGTQQLVEFHDYGQNIKGYNSAGEWADGVDVPLLNVEPPRRGDGSLAIELMLSAIENGTLDRVTWGGRVVLDHDWPGITDNEPSGVSSLEDMIFNKGLLIESTNGADISVYYEIANPRNPERFNLKGQNALGTEFLIPSQNRFENYSDTPKAREKVDIVATEDDTKITFTYDPFIHDFVGKAATDTSFTITLNRGETFSLRSNNRTTNASLGGIFIESTKDIAVTISDDSIIESTKHIHYDLVGDQLIPISIAGTRYIAMHPSHGTQYSNNYRINNSVSNQVFIWPVGNPTGIRINGEAVSNPNTGGETFSRGEHYRTNISANAILIDSDQPVIVYQISSYSYELGGGVLPALECTGSKSVTFARIYDEDFFIQILTKKKNIFDENGNNNFEVFYQDGTPATNEVFSYGDRTSSGWQPVPNSGEGDEQWYSFAKLANGLSTNNPITVKFKDAAKVDLDELFHLSVLDANGASMSYGYFSSYNSISIAGPKAICKEGDIIELRTNGVLVNWFSSVDPTTPFALNKDIVEVTDPGEYWVESLNSACESSDRTSINYVIPRFELGDDGAACPGDTIVLGLNEAFDFAAEYIWTINGSPRTDLDGQHQIYFTAKENTTYNVQLEVITAVEGLETCNYSQDVTIKVGVTPNPDVLLNAKEAICAGSELRAGFDPNLSYEWSFGGSVISDETYIIPAAAGVYTLRVYTEDGCELIQDINVTINPLPVVTLADQMACPGENGTFSVDDYPAGSSFRWYNGNTDTWTTPITGTGSTFLATEPIEEIIVEVTDNNECVAQDTASFGWHNETVFELETVIMCYSSKPLVVEIDPNFENYVWSYKADHTVPGLPGGLTHPNQVPNDHILTITAPTDLDAWAGRYYVEAQDSVNGCPVEGYFDLIITPIPKLTLIDPKIPGDSRMCEGDTITITYVDPYEREFTNFRWSYRANTAAPYSVVKDGPQSWIEAFEAGEYELYASMENGCDAVGSIGVTTVDAPEFEISKDESCPGSDIVLGIVPGTYSSNYNSEPDPARHEWRQAISGMEITDQIPVIGTGATFTVNNNITASYRLTVFNGMGCFASEYALATFYDEISFELPDASPCDNESYTLALPPGVAADTYTWYDVTIPGMEIELANNESWTINDKSAGTYTYKLVATSADGCTGEATMTLTVLPAPKFSLEDGAICPGGSISIEAQDSYASYTWNGVDGTNSYEVTAAGAVTLEVVDKNDCSATETVNVTLGTLPNVVINDLDICPDENVTLSVNFSAADGYTILWTLPSGRTIRNESEIEVLRGEYSVTVYDAMGCSASASATVRWNDFPTVYFGPNIVDICPVGGLPVLIEAEGDRSNWIEMLWHDDDYNSEFRNNYQRIASLSDTVNVIRVRNAADCWSTASQSVLLALPTQYESGADIIACEPTDGFPFSVEFDAGQYTIYQDSTEEPQEVPIIRYRWYKGDTGEDLASGQIYTAVNGGEYVVEVSDGCWMHTDTFNVELFPNPVIAAIDTVIYRQVTVLAENGTEPYTYALNSGAPQDDKTFKNLPNGDYTVYVIDQNGCEDSMAFLFESSYNIEVPNFFTPNNDGFNDRWEIKGLEKLPESIIYIYDRYGKLLRKYSSTDPAWDGEYLNRPIAADDYWYVIHLLPIDKYLRGNFTLKR